jgi:hypothetical protein
MLFYQTIYPQTLGLLKKLQKEDMFSDMRLVGGTSLALQIGHRISVDIDLFGKLKGDTISLNKKLTSLGQTQLIQQTENIHIQYRRGKDRYCKLSLSMVKIFVKK